MKKCYFVVFQLNLPSVEVLIISLFPNDSVSLPKVCYIKRKNSEILSRLEALRPSPEVLWSVVTGCCDVLNWAIFTCLSLVHATGAALASLLPGLPPHSPPSHLDLPLRLPWSHISSQEEEEESSKPNNRSDSPTAAASLLDTGHHWLTRQQACFTSVSLRITLPLLLKITPQPPLSLQSA